jgi:large subunit ribosomal protein L16
MVGLYLKYRKYHKLKVYLGERELLVFKPVFSDCFVCLGGCGWLTGVCIEAGRRVIRRFLRKQGLIFMYVYFFLPLTCKSSNSRMGSGKGSVFEWVCPVKMNKIVFDVLCVRKIRRRYIGRFFFRFLGIVLLYRRFFVDKFFRDVYRRMFFRVLSKLSFRAKVRFYLY